MTFIIINISEKPSPKKKSREYIIFERNSTEISPALDRYPITFYPVELRVELQNYSSII